MKSENTMCIGRFHLSNIILHITTLAKFCASRRVMKNDIPVSYTAAPARDSVKSSGAGSV